MTNKEKAEIILEELDEVLQIDWNFKETYIKAIIKGLAKGENDTFLEEVQDVSDVVAYSSVDGTDNFDFHRE